MCYCYSMVTAPTNNASSTPLLVIFYHGGEVLETFPPLVSIDWWKIYWKVSVRGGQKHPWLSVDFPLNRAIDKWLFLEIGVPQIIFFRNSPDKPSIFGFMTMGKPGNPQVCHCQETDAQAITGKLGWHLWDGLVMTSDYWRRVPNQGIHRSIYLSTYISGYFPAMKPLKTRSR